MLKRLGPFDGFLCLSKLSRVVELVITSSKWNLKNEIITKKNPNCNKTPIILRAVWNVNAYLLFNPISYVISKGVSIARAVIMVIMMYTKNRIKNFLLKYPTQLLIQGQWWSIFNTHLLHVEQWWHLNYLLSTFTVWIHDRINSILFYRYYWLRQRIPSK